MSLGPTQPFARMAEAQQPRQEGSGHALLPKHCPLPIPTCLSFTLSHCLQEEMPFKGRYFKRNGRSLLSEQHSTSLLPIPGVKPGVRFTWG